jgi:hypothetical protein
MNISMDGNLNEFTQLDQGNQLDQVNQWDPIENIC